MRKILVVVFAAATSLAAAAPAAAHVTVQPNEAPVGSFSRFVVRVPNERPESTIKVEVQFPEMFASASFQPKDGWKRRVTMKTLDEPIELFDEEVTEVVDTVTWTGGEISEGEFDEFGFSVRVPEEEVDLSFPALQTYEGGEVVEWTGPPDSDSPAGVLKAVAVDLEEGQGQLGLLAEVAEDAEEMNEATEAAEASIEAQPASSSEEDDSGSNLGVVLGSIGIVLGGGALVLALRKQKA